MIKIDLSKFPIITHERRYAFYQIGDDRLNKIKKFQQVDDRIECVMRFLFHFTKESNIRHKRGYLRAALAEFVSIEEFLYNDLRDNNINADCLKIVKTQNPLFHILKQLRNFNIHLGYSEIGYTEPVRIYKGNIELIEEDTPFEYEDRFAVIDNISMEEFNKLKDASRFNEQDKIDIINWINENQYKWGIVHLIYLATLRYCDDIINEYRL